MIECSRLGDRQEVGRKGSWNIFNYITEMSYCSGLLGGGMAIVGQVKVYPVYACMRVSDSKGILLGSWSRLSNFLHTLNRPVVK